jgi:hypothetical protein
LLDRNLYSIAKGAASVSVAQEVRVGDYPGASSSAIVITDNLRSLTKEEQIDGPTFGSKKTTVTIGRNSRAQAELFLPAKKLLSGCMTVLALLIRGGTRAKQEVATLSVSRGCG